MLLEVKHATQVRDGAEAEALFCALGIREVRVNHLRPATGDEIGRVLERIPKHTDHALSFKGGSLQDAAEALRSLVLAARKPEPFGYFDLRTTNATLRIWPSCPPKPQDKVLSLKKQSAAARSPCWLEFDDQTTRYPTDLEETYRLFMEQTDGAIKLGFFNGISAAGRALCRDFVIAADSRSEVRGEFQNRDAREVTELCGDGCDWQADRIVVCFPMGVISRWFTQAAATPQAIAEFHRRIDRARRKAGL